jgi:hypothetical protein
MQLKLIVSKKFDNAVKVHAEHHVIKVLHQGLEVPSPLDRGQCMALVQVCPVGTHSHGVLQEDSVRPAFLIQESLQYNEEGGPLVHRAGPS